MFFGDPFPFSINPNILSFGLAPARPGLSPNSLQEFFDTLVSTPLMSRRRDELQTGIPRLSTVKFRLRTVARAKRNAINTCTNFNGKSRRISTYDLQDLKSNGISTYEKNNVGSGLSDATTQALARSPRSKCRGLISLRDIADQVPWNDIVAKKRGVGVPSTETLNSRGLAQRVKKVPARLAGGRGGLAHGEVAEPLVKRGELLGGNVAKDDAHAENAHAVAGMHVDDFAGHFAAARAVGDAQTHFRADGNGLQRIDIAATRAQFGNLSGNLRTVAQSGFRLCEKREPRIGAPNRERSFTHMPPRLVLLRARLLPF